MRKQKPQNNNRFAFRSKRMIDVLNNDWPKTRSIAPMRLFRSLIAIDHPEIDWLFSVSDVFKFDFLIGFIEFGV